MTTNKENSLKSKRTDARASRSPSDRDFTCSEVQVDTLLSEGESTAPAPSTSKGSATLTLVRRKPK